MTTTLQRLDRSFISAVFLPLAVPLPVAAESAQSPDAGVVRVKKLFDTG